MVELLVSMLLLSVLGSLLAKVMMSQQRYYQDQNSQMNVRRELRTAVSSMPTDLRAISSSGGDLINFSDASITFRNVLGGSIACAKPNSTTLDMPPTNMARNTLTAWYTQPQVGDSVFAFNEGLLRGAEDDTWTALRITSISQSAALCPASPYTDAALDVGKMRWRITVTPAIPDSVKIGAGLRFERSTRYTLASSASNRWYLSRAEYAGGVWSAAIPIAGPYRGPAADGSGGLKFAFFDSLGAPIGNWANSRSVARVDVLVRARGDSSSQGSSKVVQDSLTVRIALRNRQ